MEKLEGKDCTNCINTLFIYEIFKKINIAINFKNYNRK